MFVWKRLLLLARRPTRRRPPSSRERAMSHAVVSFAAHLLHLCLSLSLPLSLSLLLYRSAFLPSTAVVEPPGWCSCLPFWRARCLLGRLRAGRYFVELMMLKSRPAFALPPPSLVRWRLEVQRAGRRPQTYTRTHTRTHISAQARIETRRREAQLRVSGHAPSPAESLDACVCACCLCGCLSP